MGHGISAFGLSSWGSVDAALSVLRVASARAVSEREVEVVFNVPPMAGSPIGSGDALNPARWAILPATGAVRPLSVVLQVAKVDDVTFRVYLLDKLRSVLQLYDGGVDEALLDAGGNPIGAPRSAQFYGCLAAPQAGARRQMLDFENPAFDAGRPAGTLALGSDGDYRMHGGVDFYRKMIFRRLATLPGGFFRLPDFGVGLRVKEPLYPSDLVSLRAEIQRELLKEPEFRDVSSRLQLFSDGRLLVEVRVQLLPGQAVDVSVEVAP